MSLYSAYIHYDWFIFYDFCYEFPVKLPDPVKLREAASAEQQTQLSEFQEDLIYMAATLNGDHNKSIYHKLTENLTVSEAVKYCEDAFGTFLNECEKAKKSNRIDGSEIVYCARPHTAPQSKNFWHKMLSCILCN